jgi:hypothetical protein
MTGRFSARVLLVAMLAAAASACLDRQAIRPHEPLGPGAEPLRAQFNSDAGRVRVIVIVAPT